MTAKPQRPKPGILSTLQRGLRLLEAVAEQGDEATAKGLSARTGIRLGTCYHLLRTMQEEGYVVRLPGGRYAVGGRIAFLHESLRNHLSPPQKLVELLRQMHAEVNETSYLVGWYGEQIVLQRYLEGGHAVSVRGLEIGFSDSPHARSSCKAVLAAMPEERAREYIALRGLPRLTPNTITDPDAFVEHLRETSKRGYALDYEEFFEGVCCVAAAFFDRQSFPVGSFSLSVPTPRFSQKLDALVRAVVSAAHEASSHFGYIEERPQEASWRERAGSGPGRTRKALRG